MPKKVTSTKTKKTKTVEEKIQELGASEPVKESPPQVMQVVEVTDDVSLDLPKVEAPVVETVTTPEIITEEVPVQEENIDELDEQEAMASKEKQQTVVSEFFSTPHTEAPSSLGYPDITMHKSSLSPVIFWAIGVLIVVSLIGGGIVMTSKGNMKLTLGGEAPKPTITLAPTASPTPSVRREDIQIEVLNGSGTPGVASTMKKLLEEKGYIVSGTGNAKTYDYAKTEIQVKADKAAFIQLLQSDLTGSYVIGSTSSTLKSTLPYDAVVIIGKE